MSIVLEMKHITKEFPGVKALNDVSLQIREAEIHALVGENGAGKSTLMKILSGAYSCTTYSGEIHVQGEPRRFMSRLDSESCKIEMIYQELSCMLDLSIAENIFIGDYVKDGMGKVDWKRIHREAEYALAEVGLCISTHETMRNLSTSEQQMVLIAKALRKRPKILVLDEPTSTLTLKETERLFGILEELRKGGISCIYISHKLNEVFHIADRITVLKDGEVQGEISKEEFEYRKVVEKMIGRKMENMYPKVQVELGDEMLRVEHMTIRHPYNKKKNIIEDISFSVRKGEILALAGLVGAGRSEVLNSIFGSYREKHTRKLSLEGREVSIKNPTQAMAHGLGLVSEDRKKNGIVPILTIRDNVGLCSLMELSDHHVMNKKRERALAQGQKERLNIKAESLESPLFSLSGGNQQKVVLAKWLSVSPRVLLLDEPTRGIDVGAKAEIYRLISRLASEGMAIIMISSELIELLEMCDRFLVLNNGRIAAELSREEANEQSIMMAATGAI